MTLVKQKFDMDLFLSGEIDAASAMTYNELAQVLETKNPKTGKLYTAQGPQRVQDADLGTACSRTASSSAATGSSAANQATAKKFLEASFKGWVYCRDHLAECTNIVLKNGPALPKGHQTWQMNEINALIWPEPTRYRGHGPGGVHADGHDRDDSTG